MILKNILHKNIIVITEETRTFYLSDDLATSDVADM